MPSLWKQFDINPIGDSRGFLVSVEAGGQIPFDIRRMYYIYGTDNKTRRGYHAHKSLQQVIFCVSGSCTLSLDDGSSREDVLLRANSKAIHLLPVVWREISGFSDDCVLVVLADDVFKESDYIRDYQQFVNYVRSGSSATKN